MIFHFFFSLGFNSNCNTILTLTLSHREVKEVIPGFNNTGPHGNYLRVCRILDCEIANLTKDDNSVNPKTKVPLHNRKCDCTGIVIENHRHFLQSIVRWFPGSPGSFLAASVVRVPTKNIATVSTLTNMGGILL
jgi:hypothetical protein